MLTADNGFVERFHQTVQNEFFALAFREKFYLSVEELQADLNDWLQHYNDERPHLGYRNQGQRPHDRLQAYWADLPPTGNGAASSEADPPPPADVCQGPERSGEASAGPLTAVYPAAPEAAL